MRHQSLCTDIKCPCKEIAFDKKEVLGEKTAKKLSYISGCSLIHTATCSEKKTLVLKEDDIQSKIASFLEYHAYMMKAEDKGNAWSSLLLSYLLYYVKMNKISAMFELAKCNDSNSIIEAYHIFFMK